MNIRFLSSDLEAICVRDEQNPVRNGVEVRFFCLLLESKWSRSLESNFKFETKNDPV